MTRTNETVGSRAPRLLLRLAVGGCLLVILAGYTVRLFDLSRKNYGEGGVFAFVERMRQERISPSWTADIPYTLTNYGPGYHWAVMAVSPLTPWDHTLVPGRLLSFPSQPCWQRPR